MSDPLLRVRNLQVRFGAFAAVRDVSFDLAEGETVGLVGESGSGKSTLARAILRLIPAAGGQVLWGGEDLLACSPKELRQRRRDLQIVFQDPLASLNPRMTVGEALAEPLKIFEPTLSAGARAARIADMLERVGLTADMARATRTNSAAVSVSASASPAHDAAAEIVDLRRAGQLSGCVHPGADRQPAGRPAEGAGHRHAVHQPQSGRGAAFEPPGAGALPGPVDGSCRLRRAVCGPGSPLHTSLAGGRAGPDARRRRQGADPRAKILPWARRPRGACFTIAAAM